MKKNWFKSLMGVCILPLPLIGISSCSKSTDLENLSKILQEDIVKIFIDDISPIYRETFKTRKIADFIKKFAVDNGFEVFEDEYRATEFSPNLSSGNVWYDIPATNGCENWNGLTLQAHMDMVCDVDDPKNPYDWETNGVKAVVEGDYIHTKDFRTSLGADNGIGIASLLSITKHRNDFKHGKIRMLFTADEEDGDSGSSVLTAESLSNDLIINIDSEDLGWITKSCAGTDTLSFDIELDWINESSTQYTYNLEIKDLWGDHSATCINEGRANALKAVVECLSKIDCSKKIISVKCNGPDNNIPARASITFVANKELDLTITDKLTQYVKETYPIETYAVITLTSVNTNLSKKVLSIENSAKVFNLIKNLHFGPYKWFDEEHKQVCASSNIAPFNIENDSNLIFQTMIRSAVKSYETELENINIKAAIDQFGKEKTNYTAIYTPAWEYEEYNPLCDLMLKAFKQENIDTTIDNCHGWLECSFFKEQRPNAHIISVGPDIKNGHSYIGALKISSIKPLIKSILYCCENINEIKK